MDQNYEAFVNVIHAARPARKLGIFKQAHHRSSDRENCKIEHRHNRSPLVCPTLSPPTFARKSAVLGRHGGFSFADLQHPSSVNAPIFVPDSKELTP
jgi:hypothetical protein